MKNNKSTLVMLIGIFIFIMVAGGVSYAYFVYNKDVALADLTSGSINISFNTTANTSSVVSTQPLNDNLGKNYPKYLEFTVNGTVDIEDILYELEIVPSSDNTLDGRYVKLYLTEVVNDEEYPLTSPVRYSELYDSLANNGKGMYQEVLTGNINGTIENTTHKYRLRTWVSSDYENASGGEFNYSIYLYAENIDAENYRKLTFKFDDEREESLSKYVELGREYGSLPTPYKEGYIFLGLNGKNIMPDFSIRKVKHPGGGTGYNNTYKRDNLGNGIYLNMSSHNYYLGGWDESSYEINYTNSTLNVYSGGGGYGVCIDGIVNPNTQYVASVNLVNSTWIWGAYKKDGTYIDYSYKKSFQTSSDTYYIMQCVPRDDRTTLASLSHLQIEEGSVATEWEPYFVTNETKVTEWNRDIVLSAIWESKQIELSKETYIEEDLTTWNVNDVTVNDGVVTLNTSSSYLESNYIDVNGEFWYITFDVYKEKTSQGQSYGTFYLKTSFYNNNYSAVSAYCGQTEKAAAGRITLNEWNVDKMISNTLEEVKYSRLHYGSNVKYVKIKFQGQGGTFPYSLRNAKIHGQMPNSFYIIDIKENENYEAVSLKYAKGEQTVLYMKSNGIDVSDNQIRVEENGVYTVYAKYADGYENVYTIEVTNITE